MSEVDLICELNFNFNLELFSPDIVQHEGDIMSGKRP